MAKINVVFLKEPWNSSVSWISFFFVNNYVTHLETEVTCQQKLFYYIIQLYVKDFFIDWDYCGKLSYECRQKIYNLYYLA